MTERQEFLMDLALHLGKTVGELQREMTEVELDLWLKYAQKKLLPWRRMELYLAQIAYVTVAVWGSSSRSEFNDFVDFFVAEEEADEAALDAVFGMRKVKPTKGEEVKE